MAPYRQLFLCTFLIAFLTFGTSQGAVSISTPPPDTAEYTLRLVDSLSSRQTPYSLGEDMVVTYLTPKSSASHQNKLIRRTKRGSLQMVSNDQIQINDIWIPMNQITRINKPGKGKLTAIRAILGAIWFATLLGVSPGFLLMWVFYSIICWTCDNTSRWSPEALSFLGLGILTGIPVIRFMFDPNRTFFLGATVSLTKKRYSVQPLRSSSNQD